MPDVYKPEMKHLTHKSKEHLEVEAMTGYKLSMRQKRFAERFAEGDTSAAGAAREAGYSPKTAGEQAGRLLNPQISPQVVAYLAHLREEAQARYGVTRDGMLKRLHELSKGAEEAGQFSASIVAEKTRASLAGLTIDRRETISTVHDMTKGQVLARLEELKKKHPGVFDAVEGSYEEIKPIPRSDLIDVTPDE